MQAFLALTILLAQQSIPPLSQNPSPMRETTREHSRLEQSEPEGERWMLRALPGREVPLFLPARSADSERVDLVIHFHGAAWIAEVAAAGQDRDLAIATVHAGAGSGIYDRTFSDPTLLPALLEEARSTLAPRRIDRVWLTGFSAGFGAIRAVLRDLEHPEIAGILLLDGLHTAYVPDGKVIAEGGSVDQTAMDPFVRFAEKARAGEGRIVITHSEIFPGTFASTTETSDNLIARLGLRRTAVLRWGPIGMQQLSEVQEEGLTIAGFAGNSAPDHIDHFHAMPEFLTLLLK